MNYRLTPYNAQGPTPYNDLKDDIIRLIWWYSYLTNKKTSYNDNKLTANYNLQTDNSNSLNKNTDIAKSKI